jgi:hypothetical protein
MLQQFTNNDWIVILTLSSALSVAMFLLMFFLKQAERQKKELISTIRDSYEKQIYLMTDRLTGSAERWKDVNHLLVNAQESEERMDLGGPVRISSFLRANGIRTEEIQIDPKLVLVLTPFNDRYNETFENIRSVCQDVGLKCLRGDEEFLQSDILKHVLTLICRASIVVANIEGRNPNVYYELGIAHSLGKNTLMVAKTTEGLPFDIKSKRIIVYRNSVELSSRLKDEFLKLAFSTRPNVEANKEDQTLLIEDAQYGINDRWFDVSAILRGKIEKGKLSVVIGNDLAGDPAVGTPKSLVIKYRKNGVQYIKVIGENSRLDII